MTIGIFPGLALVAAGLVLIALVWVVAHWALRLQPAWQAAIKSQDRAEEKNAAQTDAVLLVHPGGRVGYINEVARDWFDIGSEELPNLERCARRVRPSEVFWRLCSAEGSARLAVGNKLVEAISYHIPGVEEGLLVSLRLPEISSSLWDTQEISGSVLRIITDFGQEVTSNLHLDATLLAVIGNIEKLVPSDVIEIKVKEEASQLFTAYRMGNVNGETHLEQSLETRFGNYSAYIAESMESLFVPDTQKFDKVRFLNETDQYPIRSYMGIPLFAGGELIGILEVGQIAAEIYTQEDREILRLVAGQAAVAVRNAILYETEQKRARELSSLANLAQSVGSLQDPQSFFGALLKSIQPLFDVEILGFLLYDEDRRTLEGQVPFEGIPPHIVNIYRAEVPLNSPGDIIVHAGEILVTEDAKIDSRWEDLRLHTIAQAMSIQESALIPLISGERFIGYLQLSNHKENKRPFSAGETHLMGVVAGQVATIIDNASLVQQTRQRARRAETMRRVASLVSSSATLDETFRFSIQELVQLLGATTAVIFLLNHKEGALQAHASSAYGIERSLFEEFHKLYINNPQYRMTVISRQRAFLSGDLQNDRRVLDYYRPLVDASGMNSAIVVPLVVKDRGVGEMMLGSASRDYFTHYDLQVASTVAEQLALALEASRATEQTDEKLRQRVDYLTTISRVGQELNSSLNLKYLLQVVYDEGVRTTKSDCGTITIFNRETLEEGARTIAMALGCARGVPLTEAEQKVARSGEVLLLKEIEGDEYHAHHEGIRSALIAPIAYQGQTVGLFHLHSMTPRHFDEETVSLVEVLAIQAAIAIRNAYRYEEELQRGKLLSRHSSTLNSVLTTTEMLKLDEPLPVSLRQLSEGISKATGFNVVLFSIYDPSKDVMRRLTGVGISDEQLALLREREQPYPNLQKILKPEFAIGSAYYISSEQAPVVPSDLDVATQNDTPNASERGWQPGDLFLFVLKDKYDVPQGLISLDQPRNGLPPDITTVEALEVFAAQATLLISAQTRLSEFEERVDALSSGLARQQRLFQISQNDLPILLHKDLQHTITIQNLDHRENRIRAGLQITEAVSKQLDSSAALQTLGREILTYLGMMTAFIAEDTPDGPQLLFTIGDVPDTINPDALLGQRNPLRACLETGDIILMMNLDESDEWRETPLLNAFKSKSFIALPIKVEGRTAAAVLALSREYQPALTPEDEQVYRQIARQTSMIFQNIHLLTSMQRRLQEVNLLLDFSRTLGNLKPQDMLEALLGSALQVVSAAHAGLALMWNEATEQLEPTVVQRYADNSSMEKIKYRTGEALPGKVFARKEAIRINEVNFTRDYPLSASQLILYRQGTGGRLPISTLLVPIQTGDYALGVLVLDNFNKSGAFLEEDQALLLSLSQQVALSLQNLRLLQSTEERALQLEALTDITTAISSNLQSEELIPALLEQIKTIIPYDQAELRLYEKGTLQVVAQRGYEKGTHEREGNHPHLVDEVIRTKTALSISDVHTDQRLGDDIENPPILSWLGIPLLSKGDVIGVMTLGKNTSNFYNLMHTQVGMTFAGQAAVALENARLFEDSQARTIELNQLTESLEQRVIERTAALEKEQRNTKTLLDILTEVSSSLDLDLALKQTLALLNETVGAEQGTVMLLNPEDNKLHYRAGYGYLSKGKTKKDDGFTLQIGEGLAGWVLKNREAVLIEDLDQDERWVQHETEIQRHRSAVAAPLMVGEDVIGVLLVYHRKLNYFNREQLKLINVIARQVAVAINNANLYKLIREQAERLGNMLRSEQEEATRSQAILEAVADGVLVTDSQNRISFLNDSAERILDIKANRVSNQTLNDFSGLFGKAANIWHEIIREWSTNPSEYQKGDSYAEQLELDDGRVVLVHLAPVMLENKNFLGTVSIFRDITHEVEVDRLKSEFVATVSHELRTPMTSIRGYVDILLMGATGALTDDQTHFLEIVRNNTDRLNILVNDLLDVSRLESGKVMIAPQPTRLETITEEVVSNLKKRSKNEEKPMTFTLNVEDDLPRVYADPERLRQIINNLVENAYHYTPTEGKVTVSIHTLKEKKEVQIDVSDTGVGISEKDQKQVFERFYRGEDPLVLATPGTGLGLPIVKQLVEMHKGRIWIESSGNPGEGSTFSFTLPVYQEVSEA